MYGHTSFKYDVIKIKAGHNSVGDVLFIVVRKSSYMQEKILVKYS